jgi:hypothetical protein
MLRKGSLVTSGTAGGRNAASAIAVRTPAVTIKRRPKSTAVAAPRTGQIRVGFIGE